MEDSVPLEPGVQEVLDGVTCPSDHADGSADQGQEGDHSGGLVLLVGEFVELGKSSIGDVVAAKITAGQIRCRTRHISRRCNRGSSAHSCRAPVVVLVEVGRELVLYVL